MSDKVENEFLSSSQVLKLENEFFSKIPKVLTRKIAMQLYVEKSSALMETQGQNWLGEATRLILNGGISFTLPTFNGFIAKLFKNVIIGLGVSLS